MSIYVKRTGKLTGKAIMLFVFLALIVFNIQVLFSDNTHGENELF